MINNALPDAFDDADARLAWQASAPPAPDRASWSARLRSLAAQVAAWFRTRIVRRLRVQPVYSVKRIPVAQLPPDDPQPQLEPPKPTRLLEVRRLSPAPQQALPAAAAPQAVPTRRSVILTLPPPDFEPDGDYAPLPPPQGFCEETMVLDEAAAAAGRLRVLNRSAVRAIPPAPPQIQEEPLMVLLPVPSPMTGASPLPASASVQPPPAPPAPAVAPAVVTLTHPAVPPRTVAVDKERPPASSIDDCWIAPKSPTTATPPPDEEAVTAGDQEQIIDRAVAEPLAEEAAEPSHDSTCVADTADAASALKHEGASGDTDAALLLAGGDPEPELLFGADAESSAAAEAAPVFTAEVSRPIHLVEVDDPEAARIRSAEVETASVGTSSDPIAEVRTAGALLAEPERDLDLGALARVGSPDASIEQVDPVASDVFTPAHRASDVATFAEPLLEQGSENPMAAERVERSTDVFHPPDDAAAANAALNGDDADHIRGDLESADTSDAAAVMFDLAADAADDSLVAPRIDGSIATDVPLDLSESAVEPLVFGTNDAAVSDDFRDDAPSIIEAAPSFDLEDDVIGEALVSPAAPASEGGLDPIDVSPDVLEDNASPAPVEVMLDLTPAWAEFASPGETVGDHATEPVLQWLGEADPEGADVAKDVAELIGANESRDAAAMGPRSEAVGEFAVVRKAIESVGIAELLSEEPTVIPPCPEVPPATEARNSPMAAVPRRVVYVQDGGVLPLSARRVRRTTARLRPARRAAERHPASAMAEPSVTVPSPEAFHDDGI